MTYTLVVSGESFLVSAQDVPGLERRILEAARSGGAFVSVETADAGLARVLVTSSTSVFLTAVDLLSNEAGAASQPLDPSILPSLGPGSCTGLEL
ncbi:hypothetical protein [Pseudoclavibacter helvolus]|uniref:hypothetical protein n=1 Tax=Pseudoclavibacter helvolus TaxID=255205 RepID=UPI003C70648F